MPLDLHGSYWQRMTWEAAVVALELESYRLASGQRPQLVWAQAASLDHGLCNT